MKYVLLALSLIITTQTITATYTSGNCALIQQQEEALLARAEMYKEDLIKLARNPIAGSRIASGNTSFILVTSFPALTRETAQAFIRTLHGYALHTSHSIGNVYAQLLVLEGPSGKHYTVYVGI